MSTVSILADRLVQLRRSGKPSKDFPGEAPQTADVAYAVQLEATRLWNEPIAGWKIGGVRPERRAGFGSTRFVGPIFAPSVRRSVPGERLDIGIVPGGFGVIEAEFVFELGSDIALRATPYLASELDSGIARLYAGAEIAGSAIANIVDLGPGPIVADFGVNRGLVLGPEIRDWRTRPLAELSASAAWEDDGEQASGTATALEGGFPGVLAFCANHLASTGISLNKGDLIRPALFAACDHFLLGDPYVFPSAIPAR